MLFYGPKYYLNHMKNIMLVLIYVYYNNICVLVDLKNNILVVKSKTSLNQSYEFLTKNRWQSIKLS